MKKKPKHSMEKAFWLKNLFLIACLLFTATPGFSQNKTVTGTVTDATGEPLIGASVLPCSIRSFTALNLQIIKKRFIRPE